MWQWRCGGSLVALQTTEAAVPGSNPASLTVEKTLRTGRVTVYSVKSQGGEGDLPLRQKTQLGKCQICFSLKNTPPYPTQ